MKYTLPLTDLDHILKQTEPLWEELRGERVYLTGGTGFFGAWLRESFAYADEKLGLNSSMFILSRNYHMDTPPLFYHKGDVRDFITTNRPVRYVIHAAADTDEEKTKNDPLLVLNTLIQGARNTLEFARRYGTRKYLLISSGAVHFPHNLSWKSAYAEGKRTAELLAYYYAGDFEVKIARCYAFMGPGMRFDGHFAAGKFIADVADGKKPKVTEPDMMRSYLYASDLAVWLWTILFKGVPLVPYEVGSDTGITIGELAVKVGQYYVPDTSAAKELGLGQTVSLEEAIRRTSAAYQHRNPNI